MASPINTMDAVQFLRELLERGGDDLKKNFRPDVKKPHELIVRVYLDYRGAYVAEILHFVEGIKVSDIPELIAALDAEVQRRTTWSQPRYTAGYYVDNVHTLHDTSKVSHLMTTLATSGVTQVESVTLTFMRVSY